MYRRIITYTAADRRLHRARLERERQLQAAAKHAKKVEAKKRAARARAKATRRSTHLQRIVGVAPGLWKVDKLFEMGHVLYEIDSAALMPLIDSKQYVMAVISGPPKGEAAAWDPITKKAAQAMSRLERNGVFAAMGTRESRVQFGLGFGEAGAVPHRIAQTNMVNFKEVSFIRKSPVFEAISAYQNHLVWQVAPRLCAGIAIELSKLKDKTNLEPAFKDSIFTTSEVVTCAGLNFSRRNYEAAFYALEVLTICSTYNFKERGHLIFWEDDAIIPLRPGTTVAFPGGTKRYSFVDVAHNEKRYIFRQFCHTGILRWVEKGFRSDVEFEATASHAEMAAWNARRAARGEKSIKLYGKLKDIIVF
ncbi:hypothetical protein B0H11DRAFT_2232906 [Mycena galericulata]|nr:hypothetical protein B0H11DRAFT_2232906 [Mycena galericulata]